MDKVEIAKIGKTSYRRYRYNRLHRYRHNRQVIENANQANKLLKASES